MHYPRGQTSGNNSSTKYLQSLIIIFYGFQITSTQLSIRQNHTSNITSQCILNILQIYFSHSKKIAVSCDQDQRQLTILEHIFKYTNNPIMINANEHPKGMAIDERIPSDATLILNEHVNITEYLESNLYTENTFFFVVVWKRREEIGRIFAEFWNYNVVDAFILEVDNDEIHVHEYVPFYDCMGSKPVLLDTWSGGDFRYGRMERMWNKVPITDLNGCRYNVTVVDIPPTIIFPSENNINGSYVIDGIEGQILITIAEKLNCKLTYKTPDDGQRWGFITPKPGGAIGDVYYKKSVLACGLHTPNVERFSYLDSAVSSSGVIECIAWIVPVGAAKRTPVWMNIFITEFSPLTWCCFIFVLAMAILCFTYFARVLDNSGSLMESFFFLFPSSLGVTVSKPRTMTLKTFYAAWVWYALLTTTAYESAVKTKLTVPLHYKDVDTFRELIEAELELYGLQNTIRVILAGNEDPELQKLGNIVKSTNRSIDEIVEKILKDRKTGYLREHTTFLYNAYKNRKAVGQIHKVKQCALSYYPTMYMQKRSPFTPIVRSVLSRLFESGILLWWRSLFIKEGRHPPAHLIRLSIRHMATPFFAYICGIFVSIVVFVAEHVKYNYFNPNTLKFFSVRNSYTMS